MDANLSLKEQYCEWVQTEPDLPLFMQPWWLDAVCAGKEWNVFLYRDETSGAVLAALPYLDRKRMGMRFVTIPQMTQVGGLWLSHSLVNASGDVQDVALIEKICQYMAAQLQEKKLCYYYQQFPINSPAPEFFEKLGFRIRKRVTYRVDDLSDLDKVIDSFSKNKRRQLQKALSLHVERGLNPEQFYRFHSRCMSEQKKVVTYAREFLLVLQRKSSRLDKGEIIGICNADGELYAAAFLAWDNHYLYYLMPCYSVAHKESGAGALLALESMKLAREKHVAFDFEGSMHRGIANHYKQFGSKAYTYMSVSKIYKWYFVFALIFNWFRNLKYRV